MSSQVLVQTWYMTQRHLMAVVRQPVFLVISLVQPVIWLFLFGNLFRKVVELGGFGTTSYLDYLIPGIVVMSALGSSMWAGMGTLEEIERGTLNRFLTTPVSRNALMNANVVQNGISTAVQSVVIVLLGRVAGATYPGSAGGLLILVVASILLGTVFGALSNALGMLVRQRESIIGINTFLLLPLTFLSSSFMAPSQMPPWMRHIADFNPVNWAMVAGRSALTSDPEWGLVLGRGEPCWSSRRWLSGCPPVRSARTRSPSDPRPVAATRGRPGPRYGGRPQRRVAAGSTRRHDQGRGAERRAVRVDQRPAAQRLPGDQRDDRRVRAGDDQYQPQPDPRVAQPGDARSQCEQREEEERQQLERVHADEVRYSQIAAGRRPAGERHRRAAVRYADGMRADHIGGVQVPRRSLPGVGCVIRKPHGGGVVVPAAGE